MCQISHRFRVVILTLGTAFFLASAASQTKPPASPFSPDDFPRTLKAMPLYEGDIPNSIAGPDQETTSARGGLGVVSKISLPTATVYIPAKNKASRSAIIVLPGGGYEFLSWDLEGTSFSQALQDHGVAAILVKYRMPSDQTMRDKSIGPLQDAQQAIRLVRLHAAEWQIDPNQVGIIGFSAGGHLASTAGTHFTKAYIPNPEKTDLRPSFMMLIYPVISMTKELTHMGSRNALLGPNPGDDQVALFSNEKQVSDQTPPTFLVHAGDDRLVDVDNSVQFYEALHSHHIPAELLVLPKGNHGFFGINRDEWIQPLFSWLRKNGWMNP